MNDEKLDPLLMEKFFSEQASDQEREQILESLDWSCEAFDQLVDYANSAGRLVGLTPEAHGRAYLETIMLAALSKASADSEMKKIPASWKKRLREWKERFDEFSASWTRYSLPAY